MRLRAWAWLALSSFFVFSLAAATRPRYGGTLTVELSAPWSAIAPGEAPVDSAAESKRESLLPLVIETLVRLNDRGEIEPWLAVNWQHDSDRKRWRFSLRPRVFFHDGEPLTAGSAASILGPALKRIYPEVVFTAGGQTLVIQSQSPMPGLLSVLARTASSVVRRGDQGMIVGTGPFRVMTWEPNRRLMLRAFDDYWGGRAFLDSVIINFGGSRPTGDVFDIPYAQIRRVLPERTRIFMSHARVLLAVVADRAPAEAIEALALTIDRKPIVDVLTQRRAEEAFGLLPQWLSGYAFLFAAPADLPRGKQIVSRLQTVRFTLAYPANDSFARLVAERVALNARDAGLTLQVTPAQQTSRGAGELRLVRWPLESADAAGELDRIASELGDTGALNAIDPGKPETLYQAERALLDSHRVIPIAYLPELYGIAPRVHTWDQANKGGSFVLHLENVWVEP